MDVKRKKNCLNCEKLFLPTSKRKGHERGQEYCSGVACRKESNRVSSGRYRTKNKDNAEFRKKESERLKKWRKANPGYKKQRRLKKNRKKIVENNGVRDLISEEINVAISGVRDLMDRQVLVTKGLIGSQFDVVRDEIAPLENRLYDRGRELSGMVSESGKSLTNEEGNHHEFQKVNLSGTSPPDT